MIKKLVSASIAVFLLYVWLILYEVNNPDVHGVDGIRFSVGMLLGGLLALIGCEVKWWFDRRSK